MKKFCVVLALLACVLLSGCFHLDSALTVKKDGSATLEILQTISKENYEMMKQFQGEGKPVPFSKEEVEAKLENFGEGVSLTGYEAIDKDGRIGCRVALDVKDVAKLKNILLDDSKPDDKDKNHTTFAFKKNEDGTSTLHVNIIKAEKKEKEEGAQEMGAEAQKEMAKKIYGEALIRVKVVVDGEVVKTTAKKQDKNSFMLIELDGAKIEWENIDPKELESDDQFQKNFMPNPESFEVVFK